MLAIKLNILIFNTLCKQTDRFVVLRKRSIIVFMTVFGGIFSLYLIEML